MQGHCWMITVTEMIVADLQVGVRAEQYPLDHSWKVSQVKDIMRLGGSWQKVFHCSSINCPGSLYHHLSIPQEEEKGRYVKNGPEMGVLRPICGKIPETLTLRILHQTLSQSASQQWKKKSWLKSHPQRHWWKWCSDGEWIVLENTCILNFAHTHTSWT